MIGAFLQPAEVYGVSDVVAVGTGAFASVLPDLLDFLLELRTIGLLFALLKDDVGLLECVKLDDEDNASGRCWPES